MAQVLEVCTSENKGTVKKPVDSALFVKDFGIDGDAHAGKWHRQVSLLAKESVDTLRGFGLDLKPGCFAENILTSGVELKTLEIGTHIKVGSVLLEVTQIGKECHSDCEVKKKTGKCVMPTDGIFAVVLEGGTVKKGDEIEVLGNEKDKN